MQLLINDYPVDFKIESETTLKDIMKSVYDWASQRSLIFSGAVVDGTLYQPDKAPDTPINEIHNINCYVQSVSDIVIDSIKEGIEYCNRAEHYLNTITDISQLSDEEYLQLQSGIEWLVSVLQSVLHMLNLERDDVRFKDLTAVEYVNSIKMLLNEMKKSKSGSANKIALQLHDITTLFRVILCSDALKNLVVQSIDSPDVLLQTLIKLRTELSKQVSNLEEIAVLYQKGKDSQALENIHSLIDFIYEYMRTCYQISSVFGINLSEIVYNDDSLEEINIKLQDLLSQIAAIMENNDIVSLSDILEYELLPLMSNLDTYLEQIQKLIKA